MKVGFIGAGKVGCSLGDYFSYHHIPVVGYVSGLRHDASKVSVEQLAQIDNLLTSCDVLFLTVPDDAIAGVWEIVKRCKIKGKYICHCSGSLTSSILSGSEEAGAYGYSIHPIFPFHSKTTAYEDLQAAVFSIEGDEAHEEELLCLIRSCGNVIVPIREEDKVKYHAAAVFASNLMVGLMNQSIHLLETCGFSPEEALQAMKPLATKNLENIFSCGTMNALTGPVERHDLETIRKHLNVLDSSTKETYKVLTQEIVHIASEKYPERSNQDIEELLKENCDETNS